MMRKITLLCALLFCYNATFAQHMKLEGISFDIPLEAIDAELASLGLDLIEKEYDKYSGGVLFYNGTYSNMKFSVFIRYTPYSRKIYNISVLFERSNYEEIKEYIEREYGVEPVKSHIMSNYTPSYSSYKFIYDIDGNGWIGLSKERIEIYDNEFKCLYDAEVYYPKFIRRRMLKKWQKEYDNPLFYDRNPIVEQIRP